MTTSVISTLENFYNFTQQHQNHRSPNSTLQWRRGQLLVKPPGQVKQPYLPSLDSEQSLVECLKHSPVNLVSIDPELGEALLRFWADACEQANKPIFLRLPSGKKLSNRNTQPLRLLQRMVDWIAALVLLLLVSPVMLVLLALMRIYSPGSLFSREWHIGERGKFFRAIKFCPTTSNKILSLKDWMHKYGLDNLPQLLNVLRGEMSLFGSRYWTLADAVKLSSQKQLNKLPEIKASWELETQSQLLHLDSRAL
ncbi:MAG: sugar transferase [Desmonostoc vinosum HA7617-LM4]|jgi:lipopolysaccharide/colanic/teichoic acid biosynthesis glycosyltransferase|nr:sugar transferase [Desmonostoc vinosum HA7617-LM4]